MVKFSNLTEAALLHNLRTRYSRDQIYSAAGAILLSVNPFKQIPGIYTDEVTRRCQEADAKALPDLPPHVYGLSENAYRGMLGEQKQQAILISGESGAGKTEAAKACVKYICARSTGGGGVGGGAKLLRQGSHEEFVQNCIVEAPPWEPGRGGGVSGRPRRGRGVALRRPTRSSRPSATRRRCATTTRPALESGPKSTLTRAGRSRLREASEKPPLKPARPRSTRAPPEVAEHHTRTPSACRRSQLPPRPRSPGSPRTAGRRSRGAGATRPARGAGLPVRPQT